MGSFGCLSPNSCHLLTSFTYFSSALLALSWSLLPSFESLEERVTVETFTNRALPEIVSLPTLAALRALIACSIWLVTLYLAILSEGWVVNPSYKPYSKLKDVSFPVSGLKTLCPFTSWCWMFLGASFTVNSFIAYQVHSGNGHLIEAWILRSALILWEIAAPLALLVSAVVRYAIWPAVLAKGRPHRLGSFRNQMQHNANSIFALVEMALLSGPPVILSHISIPCFVGCVYILFTWSACRLYGDQPDDGPQYIYWFMDTTLGKVTSIALACLLGVLCVSFSLFVALESFVEWIGGDLFSRSMCVILVSSVVIRARE